jgi:NADH-quinone oxidoreductase subunit N
LLAVVALNIHSDSAILYYTLVYSLATILSFGVLIAVMEARGIDDITSFNGLARQNPLLAGAMVLSMLSLAGIPPLAGFFGKYYLFRTALENGHLWLVIIAVINSLVGVYYYFRVMAAMFSREPVQDKIPMPAIYNAVLIAGMVLVLVLGLFPDMVTGILEGGSMGVAAR